MNGLNVSLTIVVHGGIIKHRSCWLRVRRRCRCNSSWWVRVEITSHSKIIFVRARTPTRNPIAMIALFPATLVAIPACEGFPTTKPHLRRFVHSSLLVASPVIRTVSEATNSTNYVRHVISVVKPPTCEIIEYWSFTTCIMIYQHFLAWIDT